MNGGLLQNDVRQPAHPFLMKQQPEEENFGEIIIYC